jgi:predicted xylose isomerase-like sugar epimerase
MKAELETKIADILAKHYLLPINSMDSMLRFNAWCDDVAKEIVKLIKPKKQKK